MVPKPYGLGTCFFVLEAFSFLNKDFGLAEVKFYVELIFVMQKPYVFCGVPHPYDCVHHTPQP